MDTEVETLQGGGASQPGIELYKFTVRATLNKAEALKASATARPACPRLEAAAEEPRLAKEPHQRPRYRETGYGNQPQSQQAAMVRAGGRVRGHWRRRRGGFWNYYARPANADIEARQATLAQMRAEINRGQATARRLPEFRQEVAAPRTPVDRLRAVLPEERDVADLLNRINGMATESNLKVTGFIPAATSKKALHTEWPIGLRLEGSYHDLGMFLERISKFPRIINVGNMR
jgi:hypothetical protein